MSNRTRAKAKKLHRRAASRSQAKVKLHNLASLIQPRQLEPSFLREAKVRTDLPVFICGTDKTVDPRNPEGMSRLAAEAIREARRHLDVSAAHGVGDNTTVIIQTPNGWMVRNRHGDVDNFIPHGRIADIDARAQSKRANRNRRCEREQAALDSRLKNRTLKQDREAYARAIFEADMMLHV